MQNQNTAVEKRNQNQVVTKPKALEVMAGRLNIEPAKLTEALRKTVFKDANDSEFLALVVISNEYGLNPFLKQIHAFKNKHGVVCPVVGVDGWIKIVNDHPLFDGMKIVNNDDDDGKPVSKTCIIYKKGSSHPVEIEERFSECYRNTDPWNGMPHRMLRHKALMQCARVAFGLTGVTDEEEAIDIQSSIVSAESASEPKPMKRIAATPEKSPRETLQEILTANEITFEQFRQWASELGQIGNTDACASIDDLGDEDCKRLVNIQKAMVSAIKGATK